MSAESAAEPTGRARRTVVVAKTWLSPQIVRITVAHDLHDFHDQGTDQHVALMFWPPEAIVPDRLELAALQALYEFAHPQMRRFTIRRFDPVAGEVDFDFVVHDPPGLASRWAVDAEPGDELLWWGPTSAWRIRPDTRRVVLTGDETALPAIDAILAGLPGGVRATVVAESGDPRDTAYLAHHAGRAEITWAPRAGAPGTGSPELLAAVRDIDAGGFERTQVWGAAEFAAVGSLRRWFHGECGLSRDDAFLVTYWTHGKAQDARPDARGRRRALAARAKDPERARLHIRGR